MPPMYSPALLLIPQYPGADSRPDTSHPSVKSGSTIRLGGDATQSEGNWVTCPSMSTPATRIEFAVALGVRQKDRPIRPRNAGARSDRTECFSNSVLIVFGLFIRFQLLFGKFRTVFDS